MPITTCDHQTSHSTARRRVTALLVVVTVLVSGSLTAAATATPPPAPAGRTAEPGADHAVASAALAAARALADGVAGLAVVAPAVVADLGYAPVPEGGLASRATGVCSSPVPLPGAFEPACRVHDLGYDLLRVAHRRGAEIPDGLRSDLDTLLARQWRASCRDDTPCLAVAETAAFAVRVNTSRQGHDAPVTEWLPW